MDGFSLEPTKKRDLVGIIATLGRQTASLFRRGNKDQTLENPQTDHDNSFGFVFVNKIAEPEIAKPKPRFEAGAIIVRERRRSIDADADTIIAMIKRERGFSRRTDDWEFASFDASLKLTKRETRGECSECHSSRKETDWLYRGYLKP